MITILDYGAGNIRSVQNTLAELEAEHEVVQSCEPLRRATKIVLPGVGHFGQLVRALDELKVRSTLLERINAGVPFLGICLGLQALFESSEEAPDLPGLGLFSGSISRFSSAERVPHMGWNEVAVRPGAKLLANVGPQPYFYFAHSFYAPVVPATAATCTYGVPYTAALSHKNIYGVQFHPEKSGPLGLQVVRNFVESC